MMEPPIAALLGAALGGLAGIAGPLVGGSLQAARDKAKWRLDCQRDAYVNALQHLSAALNMRASSGPDDADFSAEVSRAQAALGTVLIFCGESQREKLAETLASLGQLSNGSRSPQEVAKIYEAIVHCARNDFHHR
jgi:hypothetical protein